MTSRPRTRFERESREIVDEFLRLELLDSTVETRVERLRAEERSTDALRLILSNRRE